MRNGGKVVSLPVLVALGVKDDGEKILLAMTTGGAESTLAGQALLDDLTARHLGRPQLVITDGNPGLSAALQRVWPGVRQQRCTVHKLRNLKAKAPQRLHEVLHEDYNRIVYAETEAARAQSARAVPRQVAEALSGGAASLEEAGPELLTFYQFPASQHKSLRTTNAIERLQEEFRRRVKTQAALPSENAVRRPTCCLR